MMLLPAVLRLCQGGSGAFTALAIFGGIGGRISYRNYGIIGLACLGTGGWMLSDLNLQIR